MITYWKVPLSELICKVISKGCRSMVRTKIVIPTLLIFLFLIVTSINQTTASNGDHSEAKISNCEIELIVYSSGNARVSQNLSFAFTSPTQNLKVPLFSYKTVLPSAPLWLVVQNTQMLELKNGKVSLFYNNSTRNQDFSGFFQEEVQLNLDQTTLSANLSVTYEIQNVVTHYPLAFSEYQVSFCPSIPIENLSLLVDLSNIEFSNSSVLNSYYYLAAHNVMHHPAIISNSDVRPIYSWKSESLTQDNFPITSCLLVSPLPGIAYYQNVVFMTISCCWIDFWSHIFLKHLIQERDKETKQTNFDSCTFEPSVNYYGYFCLVSCHYIKRH